MMQPRLIYLRVISLVPQEAAGGDDDEEAWVAPVSFPRRPLSSPIYVYTEKKKTGFPKQHHGPSRLGFCGAAHHEEMAAITLLAGQGRPGRRHSSGEEARPSFCERGIEKRRCPFLARPLPLCQRLAPLLAVRRQGAGRAAPK